MSVLIRSMAMPEGTQTKVIVLLGKIARVDGKDYPVISVPPHRDLIERDKLREIMFIGEQCLYSWDEIEDAINYAPTIIEAEDKEKDAKMDDKHKIQIENIKTEVEGEWIKMSDADGIYWACSVCGEDLPRISRFNPQFDLFPRYESIDKTRYCPSCGVKMKN